MSQATTGQQSAPLGAKTATVLMTMFQDVYRQEVGAEEDVHRTLPFFATALGFVIAAINYAVGQLPSLGALTRAFPTATGGILNHHVLARGWPVLYQRHEAMTVRPSSLRAEGEAIQAGECRMPALDRFARARDDGSMMGPMV